MLRNVNHNIFLYTHFEKKTKLCQAKMVNELCNKLTPKFRYIHDEKSMKKE